MSSIDDRGGDTIARSFAKIPGPVHKVNQVEQPFTGHHSCGHKITFVYLFIYLYIHRQNIHQMTSLRQAILLFYSQAILNTVTCISLWAHTKSIDAKKKKKENKPERWSLLITGWTHRLYKAWWSQSTLFCVDSNRNSTNTSKYQPYWSNVVKINQFTCWSRRKWVLVLLNAHYKCVINIYTYEINSAISQNDNI